MRALALGLLLATTAPAAAAGIDAATIEKAVAADWSGYLAPLYDHFHRNPELSFMEVNGDGDVIGINVAIRAGAHAAGLPPA